MNILTFDIEEWYIEKAFNGNHNDKYKEFDSLLNSILDKLDESKLKATFFCVGKMATDFPYVVKEISNREHEVGCHSNNHQWLTTLNNSELLEDTKVAVDSIQQCIGKKVLSYRAPAFSICEKNPYAWGALIEAGIQRDASVFPTPRDFGGYPSFGYDEPVSISYTGSCIHEFPIATTSVFGKQIAYSGGGYFRFFPYSFIKSRMSKSSYSMAYFHIGDLIADKNGFMNKADYEAYFKESGSMVNRYKRYLKSNLGKKEALSKLYKLLDTTDFVNIEKADQMIDWSAAPIKVIQ